MQENFCLYGGALAFFYDGIFRVLLEQTGGHIYTIAANSSDHFLTHFHLQFSYDTVHI